MLLRISGVATLSLLVSSSAGAAPTRCDEVLKKIGKDLADVTCFESTDLTTTNPLTTPANNSIAGVAGVRVHADHRPRRDRAERRQAAADHEGRARSADQRPHRLRPDRSGAVPRCGCPTTGTAGLVVAGASGTRSEFNGDFAWSDFVVQKGYAYASQNKGVLNLQSHDGRATRWAAGSIPASATVRAFLRQRCRTALHALGRVHGHGGEIAQEGVKSAYGKPAKYTYAVGTSNGGYQVRRALETAPKVFDGGVDWEGTFVDEEAPNILTDLPPAILNLPDYVASDVQSDQHRGEEHHRRRLSARYRVASDTRGRDVALLWGNYSNSFWEVTQCQWQKRLDPTYNTYVSGTGTYNYTQRRSFSDVGANMAAFATTGDIQQPLITVAGHDGCAAADRPPCARLCAQGRSGAR